MLPLSHLATPLILTLLSIPSVLAQSQTVAPYPYAYCSNNVIDGGSYCPGSSTNCCAASAACCAGGCCPIGADCIYQGTSDEACCPASDPSACGAATPVAAPTCSPGGSQPDHTCVGANSEDGSWPCPYNQPCDYETGGCLPAVGGDCEGGGGAYSSSAAASSYYYSDSSAAATSYSAAATSDFGGSAAATSFQGGVQTPSPTTSPVGVTHTGSSTSPGHAATSTTTKNQGAEMDNGASGVVGWLLSLCLGVIVLG